MLILKDMKIIVLFLSLNIVVILFSCSQMQSQGGNYIDDDIPGLVPKKFAKDFISKDSIYEYGSVFNKSVDKFYYAVDQNGKADIRRSLFKNGVWSEPEIIIEDSLYSFNDPFLSPDETKLYYISDLPRNEADTINDIDIWYSEINANGLSKPINAGPQINSDANEYYISFTQVGAMYFATNKEHFQDRRHDFDIYKSPYIDGAFQEAIKLPETVNTSAYEADVFIAPDESYIIFCSFKRSGLGEGDLYISFKDENNEWTKAVNMGAPINSEHHELCPFVSHDGKYLFYTSNQDIYWVSAKIIEDIKSRENL